MHARQRSRIYEPVNAYEYHEYLCEFDFALHFLPMYLEGISLRDVQRYVAEARLRIFGYDLVILDGIFI